MTVFNNSDINVEKYSIFPVMDPHSLVCLSGVNKNAYMTLSNEKFFQVLFLEQYPLLGKTQEVFSHLRTYYPKSCWKFACAMPLYDSSFRLKMEFVQQANPRMKENLRLKKEEIIAKKQPIEKQFLTLYGQSEEDPNSLLYKAKQAAQQDQLNFEDVFPRPTCRSFGALDEYNTQLLNALSEGVNPIIDLIEDKISEEFTASLRGPGTETMDDAFNTAKLQFALMLLQEDFVMLLSAIKEGREVQDVLVFENPYLSGIKISLTKCDWKLSELFDFNCIDNYLSVAYLLKEELKGGIALPFLNGLHSKSYFEHLENEKNAYLSKLTDYSQEINYIDQQLENCEQFNRLLLITELYFTKKLEDVAYNDNFTRLITNLQRLPNVFSNKFHTDDEDFVMTVLKSTTFISEILYHDYANRIPNLEWLKDHWEEFLPKLKCISMKLQSLLVSYKETIQQDNNFDFSMKIYLDRNFNRIKEKLPVLKELQQELKEYDVAEPKKTQLADLEIMSYDYNLCPYVSELLPLKRYNGPHNDCRTDLTVSELLPKVTALIDEIERRMPQMPAIENAQ